MLQLCGNEYLFGIFMVFVFFEVYPNNNRAVFSEELFFLKKLPY